MTIKPSANPLCLRLLRACRLRMQASQRLCRARNDRGATIVEVALSATLLFTVVIGIMEVSMAIYTYHYISEAAREGTRFASVRGTSCPTYGGLSAPCPVTTSAEIQTYVYDLNYPGINPKNMTVTAAWSAYPAGGTCTPSALCNNPGNLVAVTVQYQFPLSIPFFKISTITMSSTSKMVISD